MNINLYDISYNKDQWKITGSRNTGYYIISLGLRYTYKISGDVIGICQITDTDFLVYRRIMRDEFQIVRYQCCDLEAEVIMHTDFKRFYLLSDHTILFDSTCVYDVNANKMVEEFNWLKYKHFDVISPANYPNPVFLLEEELTVFYPKDYIFVYVDAVTFQIIKNKVYSTLRDGIIQLDDDHSLSDVVAEEKKYLSILQKLFFSTIAETSEASEKFRNLLFNQ